MEGTNVNVVLFLTEGYDFNFLQTPFTIVASLDNKSLESPMLEPSSVVQINAELVWMCDKCNLRRLKDAKVPIQLDFYEITPENTRILSGYLIIRLTSAQCSSYSQINELKFEEMNICGVNIAECHPRVKLNLRIEDACESVTSARLPDKLNNESTTVCQFSESCGLIYGKDIPEGSRIDVAEDASAEQTIKSEINCLHCYQFNVQLMEINWKVNLPSVHFRFHHTRAEITWSAHPDMFPIANTTVVLNDISTQMFFVECENQLEMLFERVPPLVTLCSLEGSRPVVVAKANLVTPFVFEVEQSISVELKNLFSQETVAVLNYNATLNHIGPQLIRNIRNFAPDAPLTDRITDELTVWKEKERHKLEIELETQLKAEFEYLRKIWTARYRKLEDELSNRVEECKRLSSLLLIATDEVNLKSQRYVEKEAKLVKIISELKQTPLMNEQTLEQKSELWEKSKIQMNGKIMELEKELGDKLNCIKFRDQFISGLCAELKLLLRWWDQTEARKVFFKEQWVRAIKEVHRLKTDGRFDFQVKLPIRKRELKDLGLESLLLGPTPIQDVFDKEFMKENDKYNKIPALQALLVKRDELLTKLNNNCSYNALQNLNLEIYKILSQDT